MLGGGGIAWAGNALQDVFGGMVDSLQGWRCWNVGCFLGV